MTASQESESSTLVGNVIGGLIAAALIVLFLGGYAVGIASIRFSVIVVAILIMVVVDFVPICKRQEDRNWALIRG